MRKLWNNKKQICERESQNSFKLNAPPDVHAPPFGGAQPGQSLKSGGIIGSQSVLLPSSMRNRETDAAYLAEIYDAIHRGPEILGSGFDIHKLIGKLPRPKTGFVLTGYNYASPYNPLDKQLKFDPNTGEFLRSSSSHQQKPMRWQ